MEDEICKKFPKICNCPYKEDIDNDLRKGKTPYYIAQWLKGKECPISDTTIRSYQKYLVKNKLLKVEDNSPSVNEEHLLTKLEKKTQQAIDNLNMDNLSDNVKVQFILGAFKILYGNKHQLEMSADLRSENVNTHNIDESTLKVLSDAIQRRNHKSSE